MSHPVLVKIDTIKMHEIADVVCKLGDKYYNSFFYYRDKTPVEPRDDVDRFFVKIEQGLLEIDGKLVSGILFHDNNPIPLNKIDDKKLMRFIKGELIDSLGDFYNGAWKSDSKSENIKIEKKLKSKPGAGVMFINNQKTLQHITTGTIKLDGKFYSITMLYPRDSWSRYESISKKVVTRESDLNLVFDKCISCQLHRDEFGPNGVKVICLLNSELETDPTDNLDMLLFIEEKETSSELVELSGERLKKLLEYSLIDYPNNPLPKYRVKSDNFELTSESVNNIIPSGFTIPENKNYLHVIEPIFKNILTILSKSLNSTKDNPLEVDSLARMVSFWKKYAFDRMDEIMETARTTVFDKDSISSCPYLSMEILKKWNNFKFNWKLVTINKAISDRDILTNPDYPWDPETVYTERTLSSGFYKYKKIRVPSDYYSKEMDEPIKWSEMEILMSPEEPRDYSRKKINIEATEATEATESNEVSEVSEEDINKAITLIMEEYPDYFQDPSQSFLNGIRKVVVQMIADEGLFILNDFIFPEDENFKESVDDYKLLFDREKRVDPEPTEDDPYSVRDILENLKISKNRYSSDLDVYYDRIKVSNLSKAFVKNRNEYVAFLKSCNNSDYGIEKCVFFDFQDPIKYPNAFSSKNVTSVLCSSGRLTVEYVIEHPKLKWKASDLIKCLPVEYCLENLLFYPNRLKLSFLESTKFPVDKSIEDIHLELLEQDSVLIKKFSSNNEIRTNYDIVFQYPHLNWDMKFWFSSNAPSHIKTMIKENKKKMSENDSIYYSSQLDDRDDKDDREEESFLEKYVDFMSWKFLITSEGAKVLAEYAGKSIDLTDFDSKTEWDREIMVTNIIKTNKDLLNILADHIPKEMILKNNKTRWYAPNSINMERLISSFQKELGSDEGLFLTCLFISKNILEYKYSNCIESIISDMIESLFLEIIKWRLLNSTESRLSIYESLVEYSLISLIIKNRILDFSRNRYGESKFFSKLVTEFSMEEIGSSKYKHIDTIYNKYNEYLSEKKYQESLNNLYK